ncbi:MAG: hypothetical protein GY913_24670 [Proteobacteria bacterium]|nr:hypothetical protein [Pseudomonadota bacterium]MCP4920109.1 hypothetical protein [Pseudomonadota bacterium]
MLLLLLSLACTGKEEPVVDNDRDGFFDDVDCDDDDASTYPGAPEVCDEVDNDCNDVVDDGGVTTTWFADTDGDLEGDAGNTTEACTTPVGYVGNDRDCDDTDAAINTDGAEICDDIDNDCDGLVDDEDDSLDTSEAPVWYADQDGDGYGYALDFTQACVQPEDFVDNDEDCNDAVDTINPEAEEICDNLDNDCDELVDGDDDSISEESVTSYYEDLDGDEYGSDVIINACEFGAGMSETTGDCDDTDEDVNPGQVESCNSNEDRNCDGDNSLDAAGVWFYADGDGSWTDLTDDLSSYTLTDAGTVYVCDGEFEAHLTIEADVDIIGNGEETSILSGGGAGTIIKVATDSLTVDVSGVTFSDGYADATSKTFTAYSTGGAISCEASSTLNIQDAAFSGNVSESGSYGGLGGAIGAQDCDVNLTSVGIELGVATFGGAVFNIDGVVSMDTVVANDNSATSGGVYYGYGYVGAPDIDIVDSDFDGNSAVAWGGVMMLDVTATATATTSTFTNNSADSDGGGYLGGVVILYASDSTFDCDTCDFGTSAGGDANSPDDVHDYGLSESYSEYGAAASFGCTFSGGCE